MMTIGYPQALISLYPTAQWTMKNVNDYASLVWHSTDIAKPSEPEVQAEVVRLQAEEPTRLCSEKAKTLLAASDWSVLPDVNISNKVEFETYRAELRRLMFNPVAEPTFPTEPQPAWV